MTITIKEVNCSVYTVYICDEHGAGIDKCCTNAEDTGYLETNSRELLNNYLNKA